MEKRLADHLARHHGVVRRSWLDDRDYTEGAIRALLRSRQLLSMQHGVYVSASAPCTLEQRLVVLAASFDAVASHQTAGRLLVFRRLGKSQAIHATIRHDQRVTVRIEPRQLYLPKPNVHDQSDHTSLLDDPARSTSVADGRSRPRDSPGHATTHRHRTNVSPPDDDASHDGWRSRHPNEPMSVGSEAAEPFPAESSAGVESSVPVGGSPRPNRGNGKPSSEPKLPEITIHRSRDLTEDDIVRRNDGIVLTSAARTVFDLAAVLPLRDLESVLEQCLSDELFTLTTLEAVGERLGKKGRPGTKRLHELLGIRPEHQRAVGSHLELRFERAWIAAGLPRLERQRPLQVSTGAILHPDFAEPTRRLLIEIDHATFHGGRHDNMNDRWRDRQYHLAGWHTERVTNHDIDTNLPAVLADLTHIYNSLSPR